MLIHVRSRALATMFSAALSALGAFAGCGGDTPSPVVWQGNDNGGADAPGDIMATVECPETPHLSNCNVPPVLLLAGRNGQTVDPRCEYRVTIRNIDYEPMAGVPVSLELPANPDFPICPTQPFPGMTYEVTPAGWHRFTALTDAEGIARFRIVGGYDADASCEVPDELNAGAVSFCGIAYMAFVTATPDLNNMGGVNAADLSLFLSDRFCPTYHARSDFNGDGAVNAVDLSIFNSIRFGGGSLQSCN